MSKATEAQLSLLHAKMAEQFQDILNNGEIVELRNRETGEITHVRVKPSAATYNQIRQFLKDNHIEIAPGKSKPMQNLASSLPFAGEEDDEVDSQVITMPGVKH